MTARVHVLSCGGTIASEPGDGGATPAKDAAAVLATAPDLQSYAELTATDVASVPGFDTGPETVAKLGRAARERAAEVDGIVVTHGTDTLAESAYHLDLALELSVPIVVTGSQRRPDEPSSDAPANLLAAVRAVTDDRIDDGVYVAFNDELHASRDVIKTHTTKLETFRSPGAGPVGVFDRDGLVLYREPGSRSVSIPVLEPDATVETVLSGGGVDGRQLRRAVEAGIDGVVVAGTGLGNVTADLGDAVAAAPASIPVVLTSRCHAGRVGAVYGTPGGVVRLQEAGAILGGDLHPWKARRKLQLALTHTRDRAELEALFAAPPGGNRY